MQDLGTTLGKSYGEGKVIVGESYTNNTYNPYGIVVGQESKGFSKNSIAGVDTVTSIWQMENPVFDDYGTLTDSVVRSFSGKGHANILDVSAMAFLEGDFSELTGESVTQTTSRLRHAGFRYDPR